MVDWVTNDDWMPGTTSPVPEAERSGMLELRRGAAWAQLTDATPAAREWLEQYVGFDRGGYSYKGEVVSDWATMLTPRGMLPSGFVDMVCSAAPAEGIEVVVVDERGTLPEADWSADIGWLRPDQVEAVRKIVAARSCLLEAPTGAGKTEIFIALTRLFSCEWLFAVHRTDIVEEVKNRYQLRTGETVGTFERGRWIPGSCNVTVATFQSIRRAAKARKPDYQRFRNAVQALFVDEVHAQSADDFYRGSMSMLNATIRVGGSATPLERGDYAALKTVGALGPVCHRITVEHLVNLGLLAQPHLHVVRYKNPSPSEWNWQQTYRGCIVDNAERNAMVADAVEQGPKPSLVFTNHVRHAENLMPLLAARGVIAELAHGAHWKDRRNTILRALAEGDIDCAVCTNIWQEGINVTELRLIVNAAAGASAVAVLQRAGRGMRRLPDKAHFHVLDFQDRSQKWLRAHSIERLAAYASRGYPAQKYERIEDVLWQE